MPRFAHLPLLLKPSGKGKLSKRDGEKLGIPVFSLDFRNTGFLPEATINFLAFLGWNPGTEQEIFSLDELTEAFSLDRIVKSGARYDYDKAKWFNQQYLIATDDATLAREHVTPVFAAHGHELQPGTARAIAGLLKERIHTTDEFWEQGRYFVERVGIRDEKMARKKWKPERRAAFDRLKDELASVQDWRAATVKQAVVAFMEREGLGFGAVLPILRLAISGTTQGPDAFAILAVVGKEESLARLAEGYDRMDAVH
jgi:glutamyl-tRNA synthetase